MSSITEVARRAGVSIATASRVVSSADYPVSAATRARVLDAAKELDYVPSALARGLLKSQLALVGVIVHDITDPYFAEIIRGVEDAASPAGYLVITCSSERDAAKESEYVRLLRQLRAAAVIFAGSGLDDAALNAELPRHVAAMRDSGAAVVHLSPSAEGRAGDPRRQRGRGGRDGGRARRAGPPADRLPRRAAVAVRRMRRGWPAIARDSRRPGWSTTSAWLHLAGFSAEEGARGVDTLLAGAGADSPPSAVPAT